MLPEEMSTIFRFGVNLGGHEATNREHVRVNVAPFVVDSFGISLGQPFRQVAPGGAFALFHLEATNSC